MKNPLFTIRFLWVTGFLLQAFSLMVSYKPLNEFLSAYLTNDSIRLFFTVAVLLFIETGVFAFLYMALNDINDFTERVAIRGFAILFVGLSAFLTYQGSAKIAVANLSETPLLEKPADLLRVEDQLRTDRQRLAEIGAFQKARTNNWLTPGEVAEIGTLQKRMAANDELLREQFTRLQTANDAIKEQNNQAATEQTTIHHNFGFLTQLFLVMVFLARHVLEEKYMGNNHLKAPEAVLPIFTESVKESHPETKGKPQGKHLNISISDGVQQEVARFTLEGHSVQEIADKLNIGKGTVSKARYLVAQQMVKEGLATIPEASERFNIDSVKLKEKMNGVAV